MDTLTKRAVSGGKAVALAALAFALHSCASDQLPEFDLNSPPVAVVEAPVEVNAGTLVLAGATGSYDADHDPLSYSWSLQTPHGSQAALMTRSSVRTNFVADVAGNYVLTLVVDDGTLESKPAAATITAIEAVAPNAPPIARVAEVPAVTVGEQVQLDGTASSDPEGKGLFFTWVLEQQPAGASVALDDASSPQPTFTPLVAGQYLFTLEVSDGELSSDPVLAAVVVREVVVNNPPVANAGGDRNVTTGTMVMLDASGSHDPEGSPLSYSWALSSAPEDSTTSIVGATDQTAAFLADVDGEYEVVLTVGDGSTTATALVMITATTGNSAPNAHAGTNRSAMVGELVELDGTGSSDADGDPLSYAWRIVSQPVDSNIQLSAPLTARPKFTPQATGAYEVELVVNDGQVDSAPATVTITVTRPNGVPVAHAGADGSGHALQAIALDASASFDPDGDPLTYSWALTFKPATSTASVAAPNLAVTEFVPDMAGTYTARVTVSDGIDDTSATATFIVTHAWPAVGAVVITEVMADPRAVNDNVGEWFEVYNATSAPWDLRGCVLKDGGMPGADNRTPLTSTLVVAPATYATLARTSTPGFTPTYVYGHSFELSNREDEIMIVCGSETVASVAYTSSPPNGASWSLLRAHLNEVDNDDPANWCESTTSYNGDKGTPGAPNEFHTTCN